MIIIIDQWQKNISAFLSQAIAAYAEKVQTVIQDFKVRFRGNFFLHIIETIEVRIDYFLALDTDDVWMGVGLVSVVSVAPIREPQLKNFTK